MVKSWILSGGDTFIYNQIKRGDIEGVKIGDATHKRLADVPVSDPAQRNGNSGKPELYGNHAANEAPEKCDGQ